MLPLCFPFSTRRSTSKTSIFLSSPIPAAKPQDSPMQTVLTFSAGYGLPVSITGGITHRLNVSKEIADHERLGEALRRRSRESFSPNQEMGVVNILEMIMKEGKEDLQLCCRLCSRAA